MTQPAPPGGTTLDPNDPLSLLLGQPIPTSNVPGGSGLDRLLLGPMQSTVLTPVKGSGQPKLQQDYPAQARALPLLRKGQLSRGLIYQDKNDPMVAGRPLGFQFLYNPTEFEQDYSLDTSRYPSSASPQSGSDLPTLGVPGASSISFNLILDRTWDVNNPQAGEAYKKGILHDVRHFEKMVGYSRKNPFVQAVSMHVNFGNPDMDYYGFFTNFSVLYSQFTTNMRPYRGGLTGLTFQILPHYAGSAGKSDALAAAQTVYGAGVTSPVAGADDGTGRKKKKKSDSGGSDHSTGGGGGGGWGDSW